MAKENIIKEDGKTFYVVGSTYTRMCDEKYCGKATIYYRCDECGKLVNRRWQGVNGHDRFCKGKILNTSFIYLYPHLVTFKNKRTHKEVKACKWGVNIRIQFKGKKYSKRGHTSVGQVVRFISADDFNNKYYLHGNAL